MSQMFHKRLKFISSFLSSVNANTDYNVLAQQAFNFMRPVSFRHKRNQRVPLNS